jgi:hypothetical protein
MTDNGKHRREYTVNIPEKVLEVHCIGKWYNIGHDTEQKQIRKHRKIKNKGKYRHNQLTEPGT